MSRLYIAYRPTIPEPVIIYEPETIAYFNAAGIAADSTVYFASTAYEITGLELWAALDAFVVSAKTALGLTLKANNLSTRFIFLYPRIGGTAARHAINLVDAVSGTFNGGWTHDGSGALPNGTNGYFQTGHIANELSINDQSYGFDSKTDTNGLYSDFGAFDGTNGEVNMYGRTGGNINTRLGAVGINSALATTDSLGLLSMKRDNSANYKVYQEGAVVGTNVTASTAVMNTREVTEGALNNNGSIIQYSPRKRTLFFAGDSMSDTEMANFTTAWRTLETTLNR